MQNFTSIIISLYLFNWFNLFSFLCPLDIFYNKNYKYLVIPSIVFYEQWAYNNIIRNRKQIPERKGDRGNDNIQH